MAEEEEKKKEEYYKGKEVKGEKEGEEKKKKEYYKGKEVKGEKWAFYIFWFTISVLKITCISFSGLEF